MTSPDAMLKHAAEAMMIGLAAKDEDRKQAVFIECCDCLLTVIRQRDSMAGDTATGGLQN